MRFYFREGIHSSAPEDSRKRMMRKREKKGKGKRESSSRLTCEADCAEMAIGSSLEQTRKL